MLGTELPLNKFYLLLVFHEWVVENYQWGNKRYYLGISSIWHAFFLTSKRRNSYFLYLFFLIDKFILREITSFTFLCPGRMSKRTQVDDTPSPTSLWQLHASFVLKILFWRLFLCLDDGGCQNLKLVRTKEMTYSSNLEHLLSWRRAEQTKVIL